MMSMMRVYFASPNRDRTDSASTKIRKNFDDDQSTRAQWPRKPKNIRQVSNLLSGLPLLFIPVLV
jgi:hypothetical protein